MSLFDTSLFPTPFEIIGEDPLFYNIEFTSIGFGDYSNMCTLTHVDIIDYEFIDLEPEA